MRTRVVHCLTLALSILALAGCESQVFTSGHPIQGLNRILVADFGGDDEGLASREAVAALLPTGFVIWDQSQIDGGLAPLPGDKPSGRINDLASAVKVGKALDAQAVLFGQISLKRPVGSTQYKVVGNAQLVDVTRETPAALLDTTHTHDVDPLFAVEWVALAPIEICSLGIFNFASRLDRERKKEALAAQPVAVRGFGREVGRQMADAIRKAQAACK